MDCGYTDLTGMKANPHVGKLEHFCDIDLVEQVQ